MSYRFGQVDQMGKEGLLLCTLAAIAMIVISNVWGAPYMIPEGEAGICLPAPAEWGIIPGWSITLNILLIGAIVLTLYLINKEYNLIQGSDTVMPGLLLLMIASNRWLTGNLSSSAIMGLANLLCIEMLFGCYRSRNATQQLFVIATILSLGTMIEYGFIFFIPVYFIGAIMMKCFNFKVMLAYLMGLVAPYWIGIGMGIIPLDAFHMPEITTVIAEGVSKGGIFAGLAGVALTAIICTILALNNLVKLYAGNTQRRLYNAFMNLLGLTCILCMLFDFRNLPVYLFTFYIVSSIEYGNAFALRRIRYGWVWLLIIGAGYCCQFAFML